MKRIYYLLIFVLLSLFLLLSCENNDNKLPKIGIIQISEDPVLDIAREELISTLKEAGFEDGKNIAIDYKNAQGEISNIQIILKSFNNKNYKMIITNGTPCMVAASTNITDIPVVFTVAFGPEQVGIVPPQNLYGVYDPLKMDKLVEIIQNCVPNVSTIGIPYNPSEQNAEYAKNRLTEVCNKANINVISQTVNSPNDILPAVQSLLSKKVDVIVAAADNTVYLGLDIIANLASKNKLPLFVSDPLQAKKGAALGYGVNYKSWGAESGKIAVKLLNNEQISNKIIPLEINQLLINKTASSNQGIIIPEDILNIADKILP